MRLRTGIGSRGAAEVAENGPLGRRFGESPFGEWLPTFECLGAPLSLCALPAPRETITAWIGLRSLWNASLEMG
jgi:hypothetical protein